jgi:hypothetical protein
MEELGLDGAGEKEHESGSGGSSPLRSRLATPASP